MEPIILAAQAVNAVPDPSQLPGGQVLQNLTNGIMGWGLILALAALVISAVCEAPRWLRMAATRWVRT